MHSGRATAAELGALLHLGQSEYDAGRAAGEKTAGLVGTKAPCIDREVGNISLDDRSSGFEEGFGGEVVDLPTTDGPGDSRSTG